MWLVQNKPLNCQYRLQEFLHVNMSLREPLLLVGWFQLSPSADLDANQTLYQ